VIGILHPGEMGATLARLLVSHGQHVGWVSEGRSDSTRRRATEAGLLDLDSLDHLKDTCAVVLSVCPPRAAVDVARGMHGYSGLYVDVNAVSPGTTQRIGEIICVGGGGYVDGGIIGPPPDRPGTTRLYLSGSAAAAVAALFSDLASTRLRVSHRLPDEPSEQARPAPSDWASPNWAPVQRAPPRVDRPRNRSLAAWVRRLAPDTTLRPLIGLGSGSGVMRREHPVESLEAAYGTRMEKEPR
jgi:hypothetical protein